MSRTPTLDSLVGLTAFVRTAEAGSYAAAARLLGLSPSAVSKSVARLEARLGVSLLNRTTRSLGLTPEGETLHARCSRLLGDLAGIEAAAAATRSEPAGRLVIAAPLALGRLVLAPALGRFRERYPAVELELRLSDTYADPVRDGVDVSLRVGDLADTSLVARRLAPHRLAVCAAPAYLARHGCPERPDDLLRHACVGYRSARTGRSFRWPFRVDGRQVEVSPPVVAVTDDGEALAELAAAGVGIASVATYIAAPHVRVGRLVPLLLPYGVEQAAISVVYPATRRDSPAVHAFVAFAAEIVPPKPPWDEVASGHVAVVEEIRPSS